MTPMLARRLSNDEHVVILDSTFISNDTEEGAWFLVLTKGRELQWQAATFIVDYVLASPNEVKWWLGGEDRFTAYYHSIVPEVR